MTSLPSILHLKHSYADGLGETFSTPTCPTPLPDPEIIDCDTATLEMLDLPEDLAQQPEFLDWISGTAPDTFDSAVATAYAGHQFGGFVPQLGDGRALLLGDRCHKSDSFELQLKGAGKTRFSRFGDGRSIVRAVIREHLGSIAMRGLGIPTTHSLAICRSSEPVFRDELADHAGSLIRVARSHVRFGTFEYFFAQQDFDAIEKLVEFLVMRHLPQHQSAANPMLKLFEHAVIETARLIANWQAVGFVHGVMNTDNMSILGDTLDYGPFAFMETYSADWTPNHSDDKQRYAFSNQPVIGLWNCNVLARCFSHHLSVEAIRATLERYEPTFLQTLKTLQQKKLGLSGATYLDEDHELFEDLLILMQREKADYATAFIELMAHASGQSSVKDSTQFSPKSHYQSWFDRYTSRRKSDALTEDERLRIMREHNPRYTLRHHLLEAAISRAQRGDYEAVKTLRLIVSQPFESHAVDDSYASPNRDKDPSDICLSCAS